MDPIIGFVEELYLWNNCVQYRGIMANLDRLGYAIVWFCQFANDILSILYVPTFYFKETPCFYQECNVDKFNPVTWSTNPLISPSWRQAVLENQPNVCPLIRRAGFFLPVGWRFCEDLGRFLCIPLAFLVPAICTRDFTRANIHPEDLSCKFARIEFRFLFHF